MGRYSDVYCGIDTTHRKSNLTKFNKINKKHGLFKTWETRGSVNFFQAIDVKWDDYLNDDCKEYASFIQELDDEGFLVAVDEGGQIYGEVGDPHYHMDIYTKVELL